MIPQTNIYIISGILGDTRDISGHMIEKIMDTKLLLVEEKKEFGVFLESLKLSYGGVIIEMDGGGIYLEENKKLFLEYISVGKNIGLFETGGAACFYDPGSEFVDFIYSIIENKEFNIKMVPIIGGSALMTAISVSGYKLDQFFFAGFIGENTEFIIKNSKVPVIFFQEYDNFEDIKNTISFMKEEKIKKAFVGINLGQRFDKELDYKANILIRGNYSDVYNKFVKIYKDDSDIRNITFIFEK